MLLEKKRLPESVVSLIAVLCIAAALLIFYGCFILAFYLTGAGSEIDIGGLSALSAAIGIAGAVVLLIGMVNIRDVSHSAMLFRAGTGILMVRGVIDLLRHLLQSSSGGALAEGMALFVTLDFLHIIFWSLLLWLIPVLLRRMDAEQKSDVAPKLMGAQ